MNDDNTTTTPERPDPMRRLKAFEVAAAAPAGWAQIMGTLKARYRTGSFATGLRLANLIGASAERWDHHPDINVTYRDVVVTLVSHDVGGITSRDLRMARLIAEHAATLGLDGHVAGLTQIEPGLDTAHPDDVAPFYAALFAAPLHDGEPVDPSGQTPTLWWQRQPDDAATTVSAADGGSAHDGEGCAADGGVRAADGHDGTDPSSLPSSNHEQRWHFDVWVAAEAAEQRLAAVLAAGGRLVSDAHAPAYWVVEDAEGNRHCICTPTRR